MIRFLSRKQEETPEPLAHQLAREMVARRQQILFVDDCAQLRDFFTKFVPAMFAVSIVCVESVAAAREILARKQFDAAILDYRLTNGNGVELYREIMRTRPETGVVFLTGFENVDLRRQVEAIGPARIYCKDSVADLSFLEKMFAQFGIRKRTPGTVLGSPLHA